MCLDNNKPFCQRLLLALIAEEDARSGLAISLANERVLTYQRERERGKERERERDREEDR